MAETRTVLVDVDDTLADAGSAILRYVNERADKPYQYAELTREFREGKFPEFETLLQEFLNQPARVAAYEPYPGALASIRRLHDAGFVVHVASSRKEPLHQTTIQWLQAHGFADYVSQTHPRSARLKGHDFKVAVARQIKPAAAFDDTYQVAQALANSGFPVYLIDRPWNKQPALPGRITRVSSFARAVDLFLET